MNTPSRVSKKAAAKAAVKPAAPVKRLPEPPRTSFNFVSETVDSRRRRRQSASIVTAVAVVGLFLTIFVGFGAQSSTNSAKKEADRLEKEIKAIRASATAAFKYGEPGGPTVSIPGKIDVPAHLTKRISQVASTFAEDVDPVAVLDLILKTTPSGIRIKSVSIQAVPALDQSPAPETTTTTTPNSGNKSTTTVPEVAKVVYTKYDFRFSVSAVVPSYSDAQLWKDRLRSPENNLTQVSLSPPAGDTATGLTVNADFIVSRTALLTRQAQLLGQIAPELFVTGDPNG